MSADAHVLTDQTTNPPATVIGSPGDLGYVDDQVAQLGHALANAQDKIANLEIALRTCRRISVAVGVLMGTCKITEDQSFAMLVQTSQGLNRKLRDVADHVADTGALPT